MLEVLLAHESTALIIFRVCLALNLTMSIFRGMLVFKSEDYSPGQLVSSVTMMIFSVESFILSFIVPVLWLLRLTALYLIFYWLYWEYVLMHWFKTKFFSFQIFRKIAIQTSLMLFEIFSFVCVSCEPSLVDVFKNYETTIVVLAIIALKMAVVHIVFAFKEKTFKIDSEQGVHLVAGLVGCFKFIVLFVLWICCIIAPSG